MFFIKCIFFVSILKILFKIKNAIFYPKYSRHGKNIRTQNFLFKKILQIKIQITLTFKKILFKIKNSIF